ncbi:TraY domain-containing protein [Enterobacter quasiroggenkampii]|uniref:TraY domain-containing protein n=1 Tax=Enterobacter quasiroggenkampii TaxID=2497436 RepID=UPI00200504CF|nr:TraY domain-containing protein [Enterobacter quasiroggenkampii]
MIDLEALKKIPRGKRISVYLDGYVYNDLKSRAAKSGRRIGKELALRIEDHLDMKATMVDPNVYVRNESD